MLNSQELYCLIINVSHLNMETYWEQPSCQLKRHYVTNTRMWNSLLLAVTTLTSLPIFQQHLKTLLIKRALDCSVLTSFLV